MNNHILKWRALNWSNLNRGYRSVALYRSILVLALSLLYSSTVSAEQIIRFGTGGNSGTYFSIGSLIATELNKRALESENSERLIVIPQRSNGSVSNINDIAENLLEIALAQADVISLAYRGSRQFENKKHNGLRAIGSLYQESLHLVVRAESEINSVSDLAGKRVSVDELGSGTQLNAEVLLAASGISLEQIKPVYLKTDDSIERMRRGQLDAIFVVAGYPVDGVKQMVEDGVGRLVGINAELLDRITSEHLYLSAHSIPAGVYLNSEKINTLSVSAQMIVCFNLSTDVVYEITKALWSEDMLESLAAGHPRGEDVNADTALQGVSIALHPGALLYYQENGYEMRDLLP